MPQENSRGLFHKDDIMSACYCLSNKLIYTGGHDGTLFAWSYETGTCKYQLHLYDDTCTTPDYIKKSKSVDQLLILEERKKLVSVTPDQYLRFWDLKDGKHPTMKFHCRHPSDDHLTCVAFSIDNDIMVTCDTSGQMKLWDISEVDLDDQSTKNFFIEKYFIIAHRAMINTVEIVEEKIPHGKKLIMSASNDNNIHLHLLDTGAYIGYFG